MPLGTWRRVTSGEPAGGGSAALRSRSRGDADATENFFRYCLSEVESPVCGKLRHKFNALKLAAAVNLNYPFVRGESQCNIALRVLL